MNETAPNKENKNAPPPTLQEQFVLFSKFGDARSDGKTISLSQSDKWLKQAQILDGKNITVTDTGVVFSKFKARTVNFNDFLKYMDDLAKEMGLDPEDVKQRLINCGPPGVNKQGPGLGLGPGLALKTAENK